MQREPIAYFALRVGAAFAFLYPPIKAISDPISWIGYFPRFITSLPVDPLILLHGFGIIEVILALWVLSGKHIRIPAVLMTLMLLGIVGFNLGDMDLLFRDISIACMTLALALLPEAA
ncbi:MAG: hypothetical protein ACHQU0_01735 [Candidatus Paceibacteria bacterium]